MRNRVSKRNDTRRFELERFKLCGKLLDKLAAFRSAFERL